MFAATRLLLRHKVFISGPTWSAAALLENASSPKFMGCSIEELAWQAHLKTDHTFEVDIERIVSFASHVQDHAAHSLCVDEEDNAVRPNALRGDNISEAGNVVKHAGSIVDECYFVVPRVVQEQKE